MNKTLRTITISFLLLVSFIITIVLAVTKFFSFTFFIFFILTTVLIVILFKIINFNNFSEEENEIEAEFYEYKKELDYTERQTVNFIIQTLESIHILSTTKNLNIFKSRLELFHKRFTQVYILSRKYNFNKYYQKATEKYLDRYYDRNLNRYMRDLEEIKDFNADGFYLSIFSKFANRQIENYKLKVENLKTDKAKENVKIKIRLSIEQLILIANKQSIFDLVINRLKEIKYEI